MAFDDQFETWLSDRLLAIKDLALGPLDNAPSTNHRHRRKADGAMSRRLASPAGNYYKFVYEDDDDDDDVDGDVTSDQYPISPVEDLQAQQQQIGHGADLELGGSERRQRLSRLLGREAVLALDLADRDLDDLADCEFDQPDDIHGTQKLDENLNPKVHGTTTTYMPRVQDYSTTSLEFSDVESLVSDSLGRRSEDDNDDDTTTLGWGHDSRHEGVLDEDFRPDLDRQPVVVGFVEFTPSADDDDDRGGRNVNERFAQTRQGLRPQQQPRYDDMVAVRYHKEDFADDNNINGGDFIDDDALMQRFPPGSDVAVTSLPVRGEQLTSVLPADLTELTMEQDNGCDIHTIRDRDPIVRVDDPEYYYDGDSRYPYPKSSRSVVCCCCVAPRTKCQRRLFVLTGLIALFTAAALLAILVYLVVTRPVL